MTNKELKDFQTVLEYVDKLILEAFQLPASTFSKTEVQSSCSESMKEEFEKQLNQAYNEQANNPKFIEEIKLWDVTVADGIE